MPTPSTSTFRPSRRSGTTTTTNAPPTTPQILSHPQQSRQQTMLAEEAITPKRSPRVRIPSSRAMESEASSNGSVISHVLSKASNGNDKSIKTGLGIGNGKGKLGGSGKGGNVRGKGKAGLAGGKAGKVTAAAAAKRRQQLQSRARSGPVKKEILTYGEEPVRRAAVVDDEDEDEENEEDEDEDEDEGDDEEEEFDEQDVKEEEELMRSDVVDGDDEDEDEEDEEELESRSQNNHRRIAPISTSRLQDYPEEPDYPQQPRAPRPRPVSRKQSTSSSTSHQFVPSAPPMLRGNSRQGSVGSSASEKRRPSPVVAPLGAYGYGNGVGPSSLGHEYTYPPATATTSRHTPSGSIPPPSPTGPSTNSTENQTFTTIGANGKVVNIPPPAHPHLRPGDTITDPSTPHIHGCPYCDKVYVGQHARSICRRHQMSKHGIELDVQVKKSRWDNNPNRPATEEEKHQRTLESKRRWAAKDRRRRRCQKLGIPFEDSDKESEDGGEDVRSTSGAPVEPQKRGKAAPAILNRPTYQDSSENEAQPARWEAPPAAGFAARGYYLPDEYAVSERGTAVANPYPPVPTSYANTADTYDKAEVDEEEEEEEEEPENETRGSDSTVHPSYHARMGSGSWAQQHRMQDYTRTTAGFGQPPYGSGAGQYSQPGMYQAGLSPVRAASAVRFSQISPPRFELPVVPSIGQRMAEASQPDVFTKDAPKTPPLPSSKGKQTDSDAAEILLAISASPVKAPATEDKPAAGFGGRHRSNSSLSNPALMFPPPEATPEVSRASGDLRTVEEDEEETPAPTRTIYSKAASSSAGTWHSRPRQSSIGDLDDPFRPPSLRHSGFDPSSSVSRRTVFSPMTPAELGPPVDIVSYRQAPPPPPAFARKSRVVVESRSHSSLLSSPATPMNKIEQKDMPRPIVPTFGGSLMTPLRPGTLTDASPANFLFSSPNGLDLTHRLGLAPSAPMPDSPTWLEMVRATPDAKVTKRNRTTPEASSEDDAEQELSGLGSPTKRIRSEVSV